MGGDTFSHSHPCNHPHNLLCRHRVHNPGQNQPGHCYEQGPEHFLYLLILPKRIDDRLRICLHTLLHQLRQEDKQRKKQNRSTNKCQGDLRPSCKEDPGRDCNTSCQITGHHHFTEPEVMFSLKIVSTLLIVQCGNIKDANSVQHPVPHGMRLFRIRNDTKEQHRDW